MIVLYVNPPLCTSSKPEKLIENSLLTAIIFVISVRAVLFSIAHSCCQETSSPLTAKHAGRALTIVFVRFIFTCKVAITPQIFLDTFAIFARELLITTPETWKASQISHLCVTIRINIFATSCHDRLALYDYFATLHHSITLQFETIAKVAEVNWWSSLSVTLLKTTYQIMRGVREKMGQYLVQQNKAKRSNSQSWQWRYRSLHLSRQQENLLLQRLSIKYEKDHE